MKAALLCMLVACSTSGSSSGAGSATKQVPQLPAGEVQRGQDACNAYATKVCACTSPAAQKACPLAKALPEALQLALSTSLNPSTDREDALRAQTNIRETAKNCIEQAAKLPAIGCP